jgi:hypothetical protein
MTRCGHYLPGFRASCLTVGVLYVVLAAGLLLRGVEPSMGEFAVPPVVLASPHYHDAIVWVYTHQIVLGLVIGAIGLTVTDPGSRRGVARLLFAVHILYTWLDVRSSDSALGNGLYKGPGSLIPVFVCLFVLMLFAHLSVCRPERALAAPAGS